MAEGARASDINDKSSQSQDLTLGKKKGKKRDTDRETKRQNRCG